MKHTAETPIRVCMVRSPTAEQDRHISAAVAQQSVGNSVERSSNEFIPYTLAEDGDELDVLVVSDTAHIQNDTYIDVYIVGALLMEDECGTYHKLLAVTTSDYESGDIQSLYDIPADRLESIQTFFSNCENAVAQRRCLRNNPLRIQGFTLEDYYKKNEPDKWSVVHGFVGKPAAIKLYQKSILPHNITDEVSSSSIAVEVGSSAKTVELSAHT